VHDMQRLYDEWLVMSLVIACGSDVRTLRNMPLVITGRTLHFMHHIRCISIHELLCFRFSSASVSMILLSAGTAASIKMHVFFFVFLISISGLFAATSLSVGRP
jgi:hypothetical protein